MKAAFILVPLCWLAGVAIFGIVSGPDPTAGRAASYLFLSSVPSVAIFAVVLRQTIRKHTTKSLTLVRAAVVAAISLVPVQAAIVNITMTQRWEDTTIALFAFAAALALLMALAATLASD